MKVYSTSTLAKPPESGFPNYAEVDAKSEYRQLLGRRFDGRPLARNWRPVELYIATPRLPKPDFYGFGSAWVINQRAAELAGEALEMSGELLPVKMDGAPEDFYIYNCTNCMNVVDRDRSVWNSLGRKGEFKVLQKPAFFGDRFGEETLFKIIEDGAFTNYCLERSGEALEGEFKAVVEKNQLTGLEFELIWSDCVSQDLPPAGQVGGQK